ncbi:hypothetical protein Taro_027021 [Colocasia esculenta]|uniref:Uncharacterized protein n=1 Tax=Colocasia esculenta TaxID=4460 RepID=A0A843VDF8_COLES|nr:hypothetical protein [Colocasia esculenta]
MQLKAYADLRQYHISYCTYSACTTGIVDYTNYDDMKGAIRKLDDSEFRNAFTRAYIRVKAYDSHHSPSRSRSRSYSKSRSPSRSRSYDRSRSRSKSPKAKNPRHSPSRSRSKSVSLRSRSVSKERPLSRCVLMRRFGELGTEWDLALYAVSGVNNHWKQTISLHVEDVLWIKISFKIQIPVSICKKFFFSFMFPYHVISSSGSTDPLFLQPPRNKGASKSPPKRSPSRSRSLSRPDRSLLKAT